MEKNVSPVNHDMIKKPEARRSQVASAHMERNTLPVNPVEASTRSQEKTPIQNMTASFEPKEPEEPTKPRAERRSLRTLRKPKRLRYDKMGNFAIDHEGTPQYADYESDITEKEYKNDDKWSDMTDLSNEESTL